MYKNIGQSHLDIQCNDEIVFFITFQLNIKRIFRKYNQVHL